MSIAWITIAATDLNDYLVGAQMTALRTIALAGGQSDPFAHVMADVCARVRAEVQGCRTNLVSATANSVPPDLKTQTCFLIIEAMQLRLPSLKLSEDQKTAIKDAKEYLRRVAKCEVPIAQPTDPLTPTQVQRGGPMVVVNSNPRLNTRSTLSGL